MNLTNYVFENRPVRIVTKDGQPWFVAVDVCRILALSNTGEAIRSLEDDERMTIRNPDSHSGRRGGAQSLIVLSESGLYALIFKSQKPSAKKFRKWVTAEVLPQIRATGQFTGRLPSRAELAQMVIDQDATLDVASEILDRTLPIHQYGELAKNGMPKTGFRRAAFVAAKNRLAEAANLLQLSAQMEMDLALS